jgi:hypothetical protein
VDDLAANGLLVGDSPPTCWERSVETLTARKEEINGFAVVSDEQIEGYILYIEDEIFALRTLAHDGGKLLNRLLAQMAPTALRLSKVHPVEIPATVLANLGFTPAGNHRLYATTARSS